MYEEIVKFIRDKNRFSPTILYDILRSEYMIDYSDDLVLVNDDITLLSRDDYTYLKKICHDNGIEYSLFADLLDLEKINVGYNRRTDVIKQIKSKFSQEYLILNATGDSYED